MLHSSLVPTKDSQKDDMQEHVTHIMQDMGVVCLVLSAPNGSCSGGCTNGG